MEPNKRDSYYQKMTAQLEEWEARLGLAKAKVKEKVADAKIAAGGQSGDLDRKHAELRAKLAELKTAADDRWENLKKEVEQRWAAIKDYASRDKPAS
jgi:hypothetical protein